jgi:pantetheine-phosphate adenylyltransferase
MFPNLVLGVADSRSKRPFFAQQERIEIAREVLSHYPNVQVKGFNGLLKDFVKSQGAKVVVRVYGLSVTLKTSFSLRG